MYVWIWMLDASVDTSVIISYVLSLTCLKRCVDTHKAYICRVLLATYCKILYSCKESCMSSYIELSHVTYNDNLIYSLRKEVELVKSVSLLLSETCSRSTLTVNSPRRVEICTV